MIVILHRYTKATLYASATANDIATAIVEAVKTGADLRGADLHGADLRGADLRGANLHGADLADADLRGANLHGADLRGADLHGAYLGGADLHGANLHGANLRGANLHGANLGDTTVMPNGETWKQYREEVLPALLTAGGKSLAEVACAEHWDCHDWGNCPMAAAFGIASDFEGPPLLRPRIREFIQLFDAKLIPMPVVVEEQRS